MAPKRAISVSAVLLFRCGQVQAGAVLSDHLRRALHHRVGQGDAHGGGGLRVDEQVGALGERHRDVARLLALQDAGDDGAGLLADLEIVEAD